MTLLLKESCTAMLRERQARVGPALMGRSRVGSGDGEEALPCKGTEPPLCGRDRCSSCQDQRGPSHLLLLFSLSSSFKPTVKILVEQQPRPWSEMDDQQSLHPLLLEAPSEAVLGEKEVGSWGAGVSAAPKCAGLPSYSSACW